VRLRLRQPPPDATPDGPRPLGSMVAAARRITGERLRKVRPASWQDEAWAHYDQVGELRYVANVLASQIARARIFAAYSPSSDEDPEPVDPDADEADPADRTAADVAASLCGGPLARAEVIRRIALHLFVPGDSLLVGLPPGALDANGDTGDGLTGEGDEVEFADLEWHALSPSEVSTQGSRLSVQVDDEARDVDASRALTVRVWRPHPRRWWEPDSPVRANLPVLRELVGLTRHVSATIDSRLAGAGLLVVPDTITPLGAGVEDGQDTESDDDPFVSALIEAMTTPIRDRDSAAAVVPLVARVPQDAVDAVRHIRFETQFDENARELRDEAIRRLALGIDAPPEVLTGVADVNHWTAWQVEDSVVTTHLEPVIAMICDALTTQLLWPVLSELGVDRPADYVLWFDTSDLRLRPNRPSEARDLHSAGVLSDKALRKAVGFDEDDAPTRPEEQTPAVALALDLVRESPSLASDPGLGPLVEALAPLLGDDDAPLDDLPEPPAGDDDGGQPVPDGEPPGDAPPMPASGARR